MHPPYTIHLHKNHPFCCKFVSEHPWDVNTVGLILGQIHILCQVCPAVMLQEVLFYLIPISTRSSTILLQIIENKLTPLSQPVMATDVRRLAV